MDTDPIEPDQPGSAEPDQPEPSRVEREQPEPGEPEPPQPERPRVEPVSATSGEAAGAGGRRPPVPPARTSTHIVYLDPKLDRPVSQYSPEGEIRMFGEFAAGLSRRGALSRWMGIALMLVVLTPIVLSLLAVITHW